MKSEDGKSFYGIGLDLKELEKGKAEAVSMFNSISEQARQSGSLIDEALGEAIGNLEKNFESLDPNFGAMIEVEIEKNVSALAELENKIREVGQEGIELSDGGFTEQTKHLYAELDGISGRLEELDDQLSSGTLPTEEVESLEREYANLVYQLEIKGEKLGEIERAYANSEEAQRLEENQQLYAELNQKAEEYVDTISTLESAQNDYNKAVAQAQEESTGLGDVLKDVTDEMNPLNEVLGMLPKPLQAGIKGLQGMTGASKKLIAVPLLAVISAIVLGVMALVKWFKSSAEGQMKFAKVTGYLTGILDQLGEIVLSVGEAIYNAFTNPQEAVKQLWETIKSQIVNRITGLGKIFKALGKIISSGFREGYGDLGDAFLQTTTGIEDLSQKTKDYITGLDEAGKKTSALRVAEEQLHRDRSNWAEKEAELDSKIALAQNKMYAGNDAEKSKAAKELEEYVSEKYAQKVKFAQEELRITQEMNALTTNAQADYDKENQLKAQLLQLETQRTRELSRSERLMGRINKKSEKGVTLAQQQQQQLDAYNETLKKLEDEASHAEYEADKNALTSKKAILDAEHNYELALIENKRQAFIDQFQGIDVDTSSFDILIALLYEKRARSEQELLNEAVSGFETAEQKRDAIIKEYANRREALEEAGGSEANLRILDEREVAELAKFDTMMQDKASIVSKMFADMSERSISELKLIQVEAKALLDFLTSGEWDEETGSSFGLSKEQFDDIVSDPQKLEAFKKGLTDIKKAILELGSPIDKISDGLKKLFSKDSDNTKEQLEGLQQITQGYNDIANAVGLVSSALGNLSDLTGSETLGALAEGLNDVLSVGSDTMAGAETGAKLGGTVGAIVGATAGLIKGVTGIFARNKRHRDELRKQVEENKKAEYFGQLEVEEIWRRKYEWSKKIGEATLHHIAREGEELKKQATANERAQDELWAKLRKEEYKAGERFKKTGLFGWGKGKIVEEWKEIGRLSFEQIEKLAFEGKLSETAQRYYEALKKARDEGEDLQQMQLEYLESLKETYTGTTYDSLVSGIVSAFQQGKRSAKDFATSFEELMEGAITSSLQLLADEEMRSWYEDFASKSEDGLTEEDINDLRDEWVRLNENLAKKAKELEEATGVVIGGATTQSGASVGAYEKVTQEQWSETDGLFRGMHLVAIESNNHLRGIASWGENINDMRNIALDSWSELVSINKNTRLLNETNDILSDMKRNGVKVL